MLTDQQAAISELLTRSGRDFIPIRRGFAQDRARGGGAGPLAAFVSGRRRRALDLYLLLHALASKEPWDVELPGVVWGRLLGLGRETSSSAISRQWDWLEQQHLIQQVKVGRERRLFLRRDDGSRGLYTHPGRAGDGYAAEGDYFKIPHAYWDAGMQDFSDLPTKAVLIIALSLSDDFLLPLDRGPEWYGISKDTLRTGMRGLTTRGFLRTRSFRKPAPLTAAGFTTERRHTLTGPFSHARTNAVIYTDELCAMYVQELGQGVLDKAQVFFDKLQNDGSVNSLELAKLIGTDTPRNIPANLTNSLKQRAEALKVRVPWDETSADGRTVWLDRDGIAASMHIAVLSEQTRRQ